MDMYEFYASAVTLPAGSRELLQFQIDEAVLFVCARHEDGMEVAYMHILGLER